MPCFQTMRACSSCSIIDDSATPSSSVQGAVTTIFRTRCPSEEESTIKLTWSKTRTGPAPSLSISINNKPISNIDSPRGNSSTIFRNSVVGVCWDFSSAKYNVGPPPISHFYVVVIHDKEFALLVGDRSRDFVTSFGYSDGRIADFSLVSRAVQVVGRAIYSTKARFYEEDTDHDIVIRFRGELEMAMHVDERKVLHVRRLRRNFRGNQTFFVDGLAVDVMWDLFRWVFENPAGCPVVLLRTRREAVSRLWLEEGEGKKDEGMCEGFSLLIQVTQ